MKRGWAVSILSVVLALVPTSFVHGDVLVHDRTESSLFVDILGTITNLDPKTFESAIQDLGSRRLYVRLDSVGGDVFAAMHIGRLIRKHDGVTVISVPSRCYSGCALLFIAGVMRHNLGELGLHRPYQVFALQSRQTNEKQLPRMLALIKQYVAEMGIAENFYDQMVNTGHYKDGDLQNGRLRRSRSRNRSWIPGGPVYIRRSPLWHDGRADASKRTRCGSMSDQGGEGDRRLPGGR